MRHLCVQLLQIADFVRQRVALTRLLAEAVLHLATEAVELFAQRRQQAMQALAILFINPSVAVFKYAVRQIFKLLAQALLAVDHLADFIFGVQLCRFQTGGHFTQVGLQRGVDLTQAAQLVVEKFALIAPVRFLHQLLTCGAKFNIQLAALFNEIGTDLIGAGFCRQPAND